MLDRAVTVIEPVHREPALSIVVPIFCEAPGLHDAVSALLDVLRGTNVSFEVVLVDDGSTDGSWAVIECLCDRHSEVKAVRFTRNFGKEAALFAGLQHAAGEAVVTMDGDLQHPPALIPQMLDAWKGGADVVEAVKVHRGREPLNNRLGAALFYTLMARLSGFDLGGASDFKLMDRRVVDALLRLDERSLFFRGMVAWMGFERVQIPFTVPVRASGRSKWSFLKRVRLFGSSLTSFSALPLQLITVAGVVFLVFAVALGAKVFWQWWTGGAVEGFTTVILLVEIVGGLLMISLGIIGTYLARIYDEVKRRPRYVEGQTLPARPGATQRRPPSAPGGASIPTSDVREPTALR